jgi:hypothetical protein
MACIDQLTVHNNINNLLKPFVSGKAFSCGYSDGTTTLFDIESGQELFSNQHHEADVIYLRWTAVTQQAPIPQIQSIKETPTKTIHQKRLLLLPFIDFSSKEESSFQSTKSTPSVPGFNKDSLSILCSASQTKVSLL